MTENFKVGEIIGHRYWITAKWGLMSPVRLCNWRADGPMFSNIKTGGHGIYACKSRRAVDKWISIQTKSLLECWWEHPISLEEPTGLAIGTIRMWGTVWEHDKGYRAEYARVASIDAIINGRDLERVTVGGSSYLENLRAQYGVALTSAND